MKSKQYVDFSAFVGDLAEAKRMTVTTEYDRRDWSIPYVSPVVLSRVRGRAQVTKVSGVSTFEVRL